MSTSANTERTAGFVDADEYIDFQLAKVRHAIRQTDLLSACGVAACVVAAYVLGFAIIDQWLVPGGLSWTTRWLGLISVVATTGGWIAWRVWPPATASVSRLYAAKTIEKADPRLNSALLTLEDLKRSGRTPEPAVRRSLERQAAVELQHFDVQLAVDQKPLIRAGVAFLVLAGLVCAYALFSTKGLANALVRMAPWFDVPVATATLISQVEPGDDVVPARSIVEVTAVFGGRMPREAFLVMSTADGRATHVKTPMRPVREGGDRWLARLQGDSGEGVTQSLTYWIEAGDARSPHYSLVVKQPFLATVEQTVVINPDYMKLESSTTPGGHVTGWDGASVQLTGKANQPLKQAVVQFLDDDQQRPTGEEARVILGADGAFSSTWKLELRSDGTFARHYRIVARSTEDEVEPAPTVYNITLRPDLPPEITLLEPKGDLQVPQNAVIPLVVKARDPDFELGYITLIVERNSERVYVEQLSPGKKQEVAIAHDVSVRSLRLNVGDEAVLRVEAFDNRQPKPNRKSTPPIAIRIAEPAGPQDLAERAKEGRRRAKDELDRAMADNEQERSPDGSPSPDAMSNDDRPMGDQAESTERGSSDRPNEDLAARPDANDAPAQEMPADAERNGSSPSDGTRGNSPSSEESTPSDGASDKPAGDQPPSDQPADGSSAKRGESGESRQEGSRGANDTKSPNANRPGNGSSPSGAPSNDRAKPSAGQKPKFSPSGDDDQDVLDRLARRMNDPSRPSNKKESPRSNEPSHADSPSDSANSPRDDATPPAQGDTPPNATDPSMRNRDPVTGERRDSPPRQPNNPASPESPPKSGNNFPERPQNSGNSNNQPDANGPADMPKESGAQPKSAPANADPQARQPKSDPGNAGGQMPNDGGASQPNRPGAEERPQSEGNSSGGSPSSDPSRKPDAPKPETPSANSNSDNATRTDGPPKPGDKPAQPGQAHGDRGAPMPANASDAEKPARPSNDRPAEDAASRPANPGDKPPMKRGSDRNDAPQDSDSGASSKPAAEPMPSTEPNPASADNAQSPPSGKAKPGSPKRQPQPNSPSPAASGQPGEQGAPMPDSKGGEPGANRPAENESERPGAPNADAKPPMGGKPGAAKPEAADSGVPKEAPGERASGKPSAKNANGPKGGPPKNGPQKDRPKNNSEPNDAPNDAGGQGKEAQAGKNPGAKPEKGGGDPMSNDPPENDPQGADAPEKPGGGQGKPPQAGKPNGGQGDENGESGEGAPSRGQGGAKPKAPSGKSGPDSGNQGQGGKGGPGEGGEGASNEPSAGGSAHAGSGTGDVSQGQGMRGDGVKRGQAAPDNGPARGGAGVGNPNDGSLGDKPDPDFNRQAVDLALKRIQDDLDRGAVDPALLEELGWTEGQLRQFTQRMSQMMKPEANDRNPAAEARRRQFEEMLKTLDLKKSGAKRTGEGSPARDIDQSGTRRSAPPPEYREQYEAFTRGVNRQRRAAPAEPKK